jgi:uncharacterized protein (TIGR03382 family)
MIVGAGVAALSFVGTAQADLPEFRMRWDASADGQDALWYDPAQFGDAWDNGDGTFTYDGGLTNQLWAVDWLVTVDPDPLVDAQIGVTNTADVFQTFSLLMTLPVDAIIQATIDGSVSATVTNEFNTQEGAILRALTGDSIYKAFIDDPTGSGTPVARLMEDPFSLETDPIPFDTRSATEDFGPELNGPVNSSIEVMLVFELSPGDSATVNAYFQAVPGPAGAAVFALLGLVAGGRRRR